ncbi:MAG: hypothetical protein KGZ81_03700 [Flavobacteriales bacterium]|nr:hypothetical protein [Flavobacteriales bacterium]
MSNYKELIEQFKDVYPEGLQATTLNGVLTSTYALYLRDQKIYVFKMEDNFSFEPHMGYTEDEFLKEFEGVQWKVELVIG